VRARETEREGEKDRERENDEQVPRNIGTQTYTKIWVARNNLVKLRSLQS